MAEVRHASGRRINWSNPPGPNKRCSLKLNGRTYRAGFRTLCHLNQLDRLARKKFGEGIVILQPPFNLTVRASAGTHDKDATWDLHIPGVPWWTQQKFLRANGFGCWYRYPPLFGNHIHGFTLPPNHGGPVQDDFAQLGTKVGKYVDGGVSTVGRLVTSSQLVDYYNHAFGLSGQHTKGSDKSWYPKDIRATIFDLNAYIAKRAKR